MDTFYIEPKEIAKKMNIDVKPIEPKEKHTPFNLSILPDDSLCGYIEKDNNGKVTIYYNPNHHENRRRFTIAHELGHYILGHLNENQKLYRDFTNDFQTNTYNPKEVEANKIAARILMPEDKIRFLIFEKGITSIKKLAKIMKVSEVAMKYRLQNIGLING
jgi:Zn-dependent peptidase ImmA (M78 family)